jgi:alcohol/geraniol dehydrogenase (NADP+)
MAIHAYAAHHARGSLVPFDYEPEELGPQDVEIQITHCGICHTDLHLLNNDVGISTYPMVPGHEIVGVVRAKGSSVSSLNIGDRVGVGWQAGSCHECEWCLDGQENVCPGSRPTCLGRYGGYADRIRVDSRFALPIPGSISSAEAAPLLCAGVTVFAPLLQYGVKAGTRLGVVGIGGLGHLALQYGRALGAQVTAFSANPAKGAEAKRLGADKFVDSGSEEDMKRMAGSQDLILDTSSGNVAWSALIDSLRPNGTLCVAGSVDHEVQVACLALILSQKRVAGTAVGSPGMISKMLAFSAEHGIRPEIECYPMTETGVNAAVAHLASGKPRYRVVLERNDMVPS